jgi:hypothetical protein
MILSGKVKLYEVVGPQVRYMDTQECHIQVESTNNINTKIMLDSLENLYMMEKSFVVNQQFSAEEVDA